MLYGLLAIDCWLLTCTIIPMLVVSPALFRPLIPLGTVTTIWVAVALEADAV
jgi:hypothetical protein